MKIKLKLLTSTKVPASHSVKQSEPTKERVV